MAMKLTGNSSGAIRQGGKLLLVPDSHSGHKRQASPEQIGQNDQLMNGKTGNCPPFLIMFTNPICKPSIVTA